MIPIDAKKKENIGNFIGKGAEYAPKGNPVEVLDHDFPLPSDTELAKVNLSPEDFHGEWNYSIELQPGEV